MTWAAIGREVGVSMDGAHKCWRRYVDALAASESVPSKDDLSESRNGGGTDDDAEDPEDGHGAA
jgi:hypothetical protein